MRIHSQVSAILISIMALFLIAETSAIAANNPNKNKINAVNQQQNLTTTHPNAHPNAVHSNVANHNMWQHHNVAPQASPSPNQTNARVNNRNNMHHQNINNQNNNNNRNANRWRHEDNNRWRNPDSFFYPLYVIYPVISNDTYEFNNGSSDSSYVYEGTDVNTNENMNENMYPNQVPNGTWIASSNGAVPDGAIVYKNTNSSATTYYCRTSYNGQTYYGILVPNDGCYIQYQTTAIHFNDYEVLISN